MDMVDHFAFRWLLRGRFAVRIRSQISYRLIEVVFGLRFGGQHGSLAARLHRIMHCGVLLAKKVALGGGAWNGGRVANEVAGIDFRAAL